MANIQWKHALLTAEQQALAAQRNAEKNRTTPVYALIEVGAELLVREVASPHRTELEPARRIVDCDLGYVSAVKGDIIQIDSQVPLRAQGILAATQGVRKVSLDLATLAP